VEGNTPCRKILATPLTILREILLSRHCIVYTLCGLLFCRQLRENE